MSVYTYFSHDELACPCCGQQAMDPVFMDRLMSMRQMLGFPFPVTSGYRCKLHNAEVGGTELSAHLTGHAVDIAVRGEQALYIVVNALDFGMKGVGVKQHGSSRFVHIDDIDGSEKQPRPWIWSYSS